MRRRWIALLVIVLIAVVAVVLLRSALPVDVLRHAAQSRLSTLLGQPVTIGSVRVSLLPVPSVIGSDVAIGQQQDAPELALERVRIVPRIRSLVGSSYVIREVALEGLAVRIVREPSGRWRFPSVVPAPGATGDGGLVVERVRLTDGVIRVFELTATDGLRATSSITDIEGEAVADEGELRIVPIRGRIGTAEITGEATVNSDAARLDFQMPEIKGGDLDDVLGLAASAPPEFVQLHRPASGSFSMRIDRNSSRLSGKGHLLAPEVGFYSLRLHQLETAINTDGTRIIFDPASFTMYGGTHRGTMREEQSRVPARWALDSAVNGVDVSDFLAALTGADQRIDGTASANAALRAGVGQPMPQSLQGQLKVAIANGVVREFPLLSAINRALRLAEGEGRDTRFERLSGTFALPGGGAAGMTTNDLVLHARDVRVEAAGRIGFDRSLDLAGIAILSPERSASAVRSVHELSGLRNVRGELELPLRITGSFDDPSFAIDLQAVIGRSIKEELRRRIRGLFRRDPGGA